MKHAGVRALWAREATERLLAKNRQDKEINKTMGIILTATENEVYKKGIYPVRLQGIEAKQSKLQQEDGSTKDSTYLTWTFDLLKRGFEGKTIRANSSLSFGPSAKGRKWAEALLNRTLHVNEPVDTDDLIDLKAMATIGIIKKGEAQYNEIEALSPMEEDQEPPAQRESRTVPRRQVSGYPEDEVDEF